MNLSSEQIKQAQQSMTPEMIQQQATMVQGMSDQQLEGVIKMQGLNITPQQLRQQVSISQNMSSQQFDYMKSQDPTVIEDQIKRQYSSGSTNSQNFYPSQPSFGKQDSYVPQGQFQKIEDTKNKGNDLYKKQKIDEAGDQYLDAIFEIEEIKMRPSYISFSQDKKNNLRDLEVSCRMNYSNVKSKNDQYDDVKVQAQHVLNLKKDHPKGNFRMGQALFYEEDYKTAVKFLDKARTLMPSDNQVSDLYQQCRRKYREQQGINDQEEEEEETQQQEQQQKQETQQDQQDDVIIKEETSVTDTASTPIQPTYPQNMNQEQFEQQKQALNNMSDDQLDFATQQMKNMDDSTLKSMLESQMGVKMDDNQVKMYKQMMTKDNLKQFKDMKMPEGATAPGQTPNFDPQNMSKTDALKQMSENPDMIKQATEMMKKNPEMMKTFAKQMGGTNPKMAEYLENATPEQIEKMMNVAGKMQGVMSYGLKFWNYAKHNKYPLIGLLVLAVVYMFS